MILTDPNRSKLRTFKDFSMAKSHVLRTLKKADVPKFWENYYLTRQMSHIVMKNWQRMNFVIDLQNIITITIITITIIIIRTFPGPKEPWSKSKTFQGNKDHVGTLQLCCHWWLKDLIMTTSGTPIDDKVGIMTTFMFQCKYLEKIKIIIKITTITIFFVIYCKCISINIKMSLSPIPKWGYYIN